MEDIRTVLMYMYVLNILAIEIASQLWSLVNNNSFIFYNFAADGYTEFLHIAIERCM